MPLATWTTRDELLSDALHMRDVGLGLDRMLTDTVLEEDEGGDAYERALRKLSHGHVTIARDERRDSAKPALTADDRDHPIDAEHHHTVRWLDGKAASEFVDLSRRADVELLLAPLRDDYAALMELADGDETPDWVFDTAGAILEQIVKLEEGEEEDPSLPESQTQELHFGAALRTRSQREQKEFRLERWLANADAERPIRAERLKRYTETLLYTSRGAISLTVSAQGHGTFSTAKAAAKLMPQLRERSTRERSRRRRSHLKVQAHAFTDRQAGPAMCSWSERRATYKPRTLRQQANADLLWAKWGDVPIPADEGWSAGIEVWKHMLQVRMRALRMGAPLVTGPRRPNGRVATRWAEDTPPVAPTLIKHAHVDGRLVEDRGRERKGRMVRIGRIDLGEAQAGCACKGCDTLQREPERVSVHC